MSRLEGQAAYGHFFDRTPRPWALAAHPPPLAPHSHAVRPAKRNEDLPAEADGSRYQGQVEQSLTHPCTEGVGVDR